VPIPASLHREGVQGKATIVISDASQMSGSTVWDSGAFGDVLGHDADKRCPHSYDSLVWLSADAEATYGDPVLLVETFTDPARHPGTCYRAVNFVMVGTTSGYGRKNGSWVRHDVSKCAWVYLLDRRARQILAAPFDHPLLVAAQRRRRDVADLNTVVIDREGGLYARLCALPDYRKPKGVRHELAAVLLVCAAAMLCGARGPAEIAEWAQDLDQEARAHLYCRRQPVTGRLVVPSESTIQRTLRKVDKEALDRVVNETVHEVVQRRAAEGAPARTDTVTADEEKPETPGDDDTSRSSLLSRTARRGRRGRRRATWTSVPHGRRQVAARRGPRGRPSPAPAIGLHPQRAGRDRSRRSRPQDQ